MLKSQNKTDIQSKGFTLVETLMVILLITIVSVVSITSYNDSFHEAKFNQTHSEMLMIRDAILGNPDFKEGGKRVSFGYLGDTGRVPPTAGITNCVREIQNNVSALPTWAIDTTTQIGVGWNGPYLTTGAPSEDYQNDAWGNSYQCNMAATPPTLVSLGADGASGDAGTTPFDADITVELPTEITTTTVYGYVSNGGGPFTGIADVIISYPVNAALSTQTKSLVSSDNGAFSFPSIPLGKRSITVYIPNQTVPYQTIGPIVFTVDRPNFTIPERLLDINPTAPKEEVLLYDNFNRADSATVGNGWTEVELAGQTVDISSNTLEFTSSSGSGRPLVRKTFTAQSSGKIAFSFDFNFLRTAAEPDYQIYIQMGDSSVLSDVHITNGVAVNLKFATSTGGGMLQDMGFGFQTSSGTTQIYQLNSGSDTISGEIDIDAQTYSLTLSSGATQTGIAFQNSSVTSIDIVRFLTIATTTSSFSPRNIDNVLITKKW